MEPCPYCNSQSFMTNARNGLECSNCGAPYEGVRVVPSAPYYVLKVDALLKPEQREQIKQEFKKAMGSDVNRLIILGADIEYFKSVI